MFKVCDIKAGKLLGNRFPKETCEDFAIYGVSDPEAPEDHTLIFVKGALSDTYTEVQHSIFVTKEELELELHPSSVQLKSTAPKNLYG